MSLLSWYRLLRLFAARKIKVAFDSLHFLRIDLSHKDCNVSVKLI